MNNEKWIIQTKIRLLSKADFVWLPRQRSNQQHSALAEYCVIRRVRPTNSKHLRHAYFRKYSRFARLGTLGFKAPYFRDLPSQKDYQSFCLLAYRHRLVQSYWEYMTVNHDVASLFLLAKEKRDCKESLMAPTAGLEPATSWLTVMRSTDWAK